MELPREVRYRPYQDWTKEELKNIENRVNQSPWRCHYHIEARTGLLNDPNGFSYFNGQFHLFISIGPLVRHMDSKNGYTPILLIWCTLPRVRHDSFLIVLWIATGHTLDQLTLSKTSCSYFIPEMSVIKTGIGKPFN